MAIDRDAILAAAEQIHAATGRLPTVEEVRAALGGGSFSTITPVLRAWKREQKAAQTIAPAIPERVRAALERATGALWAAFQEEMEERVGQVREQATRRAEEAESERDQALAEVARLEQAFAAAEALAREKEAGLRAQLEQARSERVAAGEEIARLTERTEQQQARLDSLAAELEHAHESSREQAGRYDRALEQLSEARDGEKAARERASALEVRMKSVGADNG